MLKKHFQYILTTFGFEIKMNDFALRPAGLFVIKI